MPTRRHLLFAAVPVMLAGPAIRPIIRSAAAQRADARMNDRAVGHDEARLVVQEWFSLTCSHCAHFSTTVFPDVQARLIDTGRIRYVFRDFPLDQLALTAAMVARALPPDRYLPFVETLLSTQDRWAFNRAVDPMEQLGRQAALAGMPPTDFRAVVADERLRDAILREQDDGQKRYTIDGTPTFVFGAQKISPLASYADFAAGVEKGLAAG